MSSPEVRVNGCAVGTKRRRTRSALIVVDIISMGAGGWKVERHTGVR